MIVEPFFNLGDQGLPNEQVHRLQEDRLGRLWFAGPTGVGRYDGHTIKMYDRRSGLQCMGLRTIFIAHHLDIIWIGTDAGLEALAINDDKIELSLDFAWDYGLVESIFCRNQELWLGTARGLLQLTIKNQELRFQHFFAIGLVSSILRLSDDAILVCAAKDRVIKITDNQSSQFFENPAFGKLLCTSLTVDRQVCLGTTMGLLRLDEFGNILEHYPFAENNRVTAIETYGDDWWIGVGKEVLLCNPATAGLDIKERLDLGTIINDLLIDQYGNTWIGTNTKGLKRISCLNHILKSIPLGLDTSVFSIREGANGQWNIQGDGFWGNLEKQEDESFLAKNICTFPAIIWDSFPDLHNPTLHWYATQDGLYLSKEEGELVRVDSEVAGVNSPARVFISHLNTLYLGTISGLFSIHENAISQVYSSNKKELGYVYSLAEDWNQKMWVGTLGNGLWMGEPGNFISIDNELISEKGNIYALAPGPNGQMIVVQEEKVVLLDRQLNAVLVYEKFPLAAWTAIWLDEHEVALGSNEGLVVINIHRKDSSYQMNMLLERSAWQFTFSQSLSKDKSGNILCGLNKGLYVFNPQKLTKYTQAPTIQVGEIKWQNVIPKIKDEVYKIPLGKWSFSISVFACWFIDESKIQFRYKLIGFDDSWSTLSHNYEWKYNSLPAGKYELKVQCFTPITGFGEPISILKINVSASIINQSISRIITPAIDTYRRLFKGNYRNELLLERNADLEAEILERKRTEAELNEYKNRLEEMVVKRTRLLEIAKNRAESADHMKSAFLANITHELRTPINGIIGLNELIDKSNLESQQIDFLSKMDSSAKHLLNLINDVLDLSKIEAGKIKIECTPFSLKELLTEVESFIQIQALKKQLDFSIVNTVAERNRCGDPLRIKQVLINLIGNAIKFTSSGTIKLKVTPQGIEGDKQWIKFELSDTGIGMSPDDMKDIFKAFHQSDDSVARKYGGTGLGLSISQSFVQMMGGEIFVESELGLGSKFYFNIQLKLKEPEPVLPQNKKRLPESLLSDSERLALSQLRILVAEDDEINLLIISNLLAKENIFFTLTKNGQECITEFEKNPDYDIILMDVQMPEIDGLAATRYIRNELNNKDILIFVLTAGVLSQVQEQLIEAGVNDFLPKPLYRKELLTKISQWKEAFPLLHIKNTTHT